VKLYKIKKSNIDKRGLYATKNINAGEKIIEYKGKLISKKESQQNSKFDNSKDIYLFNVNEKWDLDGAWSFNTARLINHSCNPNCEVEGKGLKLWIRAIKDIKKDEELSYDYGFSYSKEDLKNFVCRCGSKNCCGYIVREPSRWRINKKFKISNRINK
tara:strand:+ start:141 stop:614 length:474 start_codon:yes stop_codon:yes gene_type:complete